MARRPRFAIPAVLELPLGITLILIGIGLAAMLPSAIDEGRAMTNASVCETLRWSGESACLVRKDVVIGREDDQRKSARTSWTFEQDEPAESFTMHSGGTNTADWGVGDEVRLLLWNFEPVAFEGPSGESRVRALSWGHGKWLGTALWAQAAGVAGIAWIARARGGPDQFGARLREQRIARLLFEAWAAGLGAGLLVWVFWGGVPSTSIAAVGAFAAVLVAQLLLGLRPSGRHSL